MRSDGQAPPELPGLVYLDKLGRGGYADVYLYEREMPRLRVAVKVLRGDALESSQRDVFTAEANTMAELSGHPYIVSVLSADITTDGRPYIVMQYYPPPDLGGRIKERPLRVDQALRTGIQIAGAVETAHQAGILHRDIKPANILIGQYGDPGLTDFGIAGRLATHDHDDDLGVSVPWSPPEVLKGDSNGSIAADVYSLAATIWTLLTGHSPFAQPHSDNGPRAMTSRILRQPPPPTGRVDTPPALERLLQQALAKDPGHRPATALELGRALQQIEQEARFARTEIIVPHTPQTPTHYHDEDPATRSRPPQRINAQPRTPTAPEIGPDATVIRRNSEHTQQRNTPTPPPTTTSPSHTTPTPPHETTTPRTGPSTALIAAVLLALLGTTAGIAALLNNNDTQQPPITEPDPTNQINVGEGPPSNVVLTVERRGGRLIAALAYDNRRDDDEVLWTLGGRDFDRGENRLTWSVKAPPALTCAEAIVVNSDGQQAESGEQCA